MHNRLFSVVSLAAAACFPVLPQAVISTHSGVINFAEGSVLIDDEPFQQKPGRFVSLKEGSTLRTEAGRAEVLLTPNVILRVGANSAIRMVSTSFSNTRVEFVSGSAILESVQSADTPVTILYHDYQVQSRENSTYRFDSESPGLTVLKGKARISLGDQSVVIGKDHVVPFAGALHAQEADDTSDGAIDRWARERDQALAADDDATSKTTDDLSVAEGWQDDSGADPYAGLAFSSQPGTLAPFGVAPNSSVGSLYAAPPNPLDTNPTIYSYWTIEPVIPYAFAYYPVPIIVRPSRIGLYPGLPVSVFGSRPVSGVPPIWRPRSPITVGIPSRPMSSRPMTSRPAVIAAPHVMAGHR